MSLAVSAVIAPSRRLRALRVTMGACLTGAAVVMGFVMPERFAADGLVALAPLAGALALAALWPRCGTARRLDISGLGQLRLTVQQEMQAGGVAQQGALLTLLPGATVWPCCMLLRLRAPDGRVVRLVVFPDSLPASQYRALVVSVRALANSTLEKTSN